MQPRPRLARIIALLGVVLLTVWAMDFFQRDPAPPAPAPAVTAPSPAIASLAVTAPRPSPPAPAAAGPDPAAAVALDRVRLMFRDYRTVAGENPVGTNAEIMRTLMGDNARQATLGPPEGQSLNAAGELVDRWGTPLFFHQLSKTVMEIRSAGPDRIMGTEDDIVTR